MSFEFDVLDRRRLVVLVVRVAFQPRAEPLDVGDEREALLGGGVGRSLEEPGVFRHRRAVRQVGRLEEVDGVPVVRAASALADEVGPDAAGAEEHRALELVLVFLGLGDRAPAAILVRDGPDELAVAVPAALAGVDLAPEPERLGALLVEPFLQGRGVLGGLAERLLEGDGEASGEVLELKPDVRVDELLGRLLGEVLVHQDGHDRVRDERQREEDHARDQEDAGLFL